MEFFLHDPGLMELARELGKALRTGRMDYREAMEVMKAAVRRSLAERAVVLRDDDPA